MNLMGFQWVWAQCHKAAVWVTLTDICLTVCWQVEGVSESVRVAFSLLLQLYDMDCEQSGNTKKPLFATLLQRIIKLPWEAKAKYHRLCALLPYLGTDMVIIKDYFGVKNVFMQSEMVVLTVVHVLKSIRCWIDVLKFLVISWSACRPITCLHVEQSFTSVWSSSTDASSALAHRPPLNWILPVTGRPAGGRSFMKRWRPMWLLCRTAAQHFYYPALFRSSPLLWISC